MICKKERREEKKGAWPKRKGTKTRPLKDTKGVKPRRSFDHKSSSLLESEERSKLKLQSCCNPKGLIRSVSSRASLARKLSHLLNIELASGGNLLASSILFKRLHEQFTTRSCKTTRHFSLNSKSFECYSATSSESNDIRLCLSS